MSATPILIPVPAAGGASGWIDCSALPETRTLHFSAPSTADKLEVDFAMSAIGEAGIFAGLFAGSVGRNIVNGSPFVRIRRTAGTGVCAFGIAAFVPDTQIGPAGPPALGQFSWHGDLTTLDAAPTPIPSAPLGTPIGAFGPAGFVPGADGTYSVVAHVVARGTVGPFAGLGAQFLLSALFDSAAGVVTQVGATTVLSSIRAVGFTGTADLATTDAATVQVVATGGALSTVLWTHDSVITRVA